MPMLLKIYLWGCLVAFIECLIVLEDKDHRVSTVEVIVSIIMSAFSWVIALALFVGMNVKRAEEDRKKNKDNEKFFGEE